MNKRYSPVKNYIISLDSIVRNDRDAINKVSDSLKTRGYAFIRLPEKTKKHIDQCLELVEDFFQQPKLYKEKFFKEPIFGYFGVEHKESF